MIDAVEEKLPFHKTLDEFRNILKDIALENGVEAVVLESHKNWIDRDPVKSLELSSKWLNGRS